MYWYYFFSAVRDEDLNYLSSEQALADVANFISNMTEKHKLDGRKWIVIGGSYSGIYWCFHSQSA